jgi:guanylate kinase
MSEQVDVPVAQVGGRLVVVSGPGGVGKGTVVAALRRSRPDLAVSVSATTRNRRAGEQDGVHYHFLSDDEFTRLVEAGGFLEWAEFNGRRYGTPWSSVQAALARAAIVVLEIDVQGARIVRRRFDDATLIFLAPPHPDVLLQRLRQRGSDDEAAIAARMAIARAELAAADEFDHVVVNDRVEDAVAAISRILDHPAAP